MFPIENLNGNVCAFGGRAVREGDEPKYLNSPETSIYYKSSLMYGLAKARSAIRENKNAIIVEGYMDALALRQAGHLNVVACGGTSLTDDQLAVLKRFTKNVLLVALIVIMPEKPRQSAQFSFPCRKNFLRALLFGKENIKIPMNVSVKIQKLLGKH